MEFRDELLNPKIIFKETESGMGAFADVPIFEHEILVRWQGRVLDTDQFGKTSEQFRTRSVQIGEGQYLVPFEITNADFFNHSCDPNAGLQGPRTLVAIRPIKKGEPLCYDYAMTDGSPYDEFDCRCGTTHCRGRVSGEDWRRTELQQRYKGFFSPYLAERIRLSK